MIQEKLQQALANQQAGRLAEAAHAYQEILRVDSSHPDALHLLGLIESRHGNHARAVQLIQQAAAILPQNPIIHSNLGVVLKQAGHIDAAIEAYQTAIRLAPNNAEAHFNLGKSLKACGQLVEAEQSFRQAIALAPHKPSPWLSLIATQAETNLTQALRSGEQAISYCPHYADLHMSLGALYRRAGQTERAIACYRLAVQYAPQDVDALTRLASSLISKHDFEEGQKYLGLAQSIEPDSVHVLNSLGLLHNSLGNSTAAIQAYRRAIELYPAYATAHSNLSTALRKQGYISESLQCVQRGLELEPKNIESKVIEGGALLSLGRVVEAEACFRTAIQARQGYRDAHDSLLMCLQYQPQQSLVSLLAAHCEWDARYAAGLASHAPPPADRDPTRPLRVGFVSADIGAHPVGYFTCRLLEALDAQQIHATIYSDRIGEDAMVRRLKAAVPSWQETAPLSDDDLAAHIRRDEIDILFDMAGHTAQNRLMVFAERAAPLQITWAGYVGTTGLSNMDYILADRFHIPPEFTMHYSERVLRMPNGYVTYQPPADAPPVNQLPALASGQFTFGAVCNPAKVNEQVLELWAQVLKQVPQARLLLCYTGWPDPDNRLRVERAVAEAGCTNRIDFDQRTGPSTALEVYHTIDVALDTFPYSGGLTTCEALWMGVPTITLPTERFAGRHSLSHLRNAGLGNCVANTPAEYVRLAADLANDLPQLAALRARLRQQLEESPLCNGPLFARDFEQLLRQTWLSHWNS